MRAVRTAPPSVEVVEIGEPDGEGELIRVSSVGICASDLLYMSYGLVQIAGHEIAGTLEDGTPVAVEAIFGCAGCPVCEAGHFHHCAQGGLTALGARDQGGMSEYFRAPRRALVELPAGLAPRDGCLVEPGSVAWHAAHLGGAGPDTRVAVVGAGAIGVLAAAAAQTMGAPEVDVAARHPHQHEARERIGSGVPAGEYDLVVDTAGNQASLEDAVGLARPGGTVVTVAVTPTLTMPSGAFHKEVAIRRSLGYATQAGRREAAHVADMLAARPELAQILITHRFPLEEAPTAFATAADRSQGAFRVVVEPWSQ